MTDLVTEPDGWAIPEHPTTVKADELDGWTTTTARLAEKAIAFKWSKSEVARRSGVPIATLSQYLAGKYQGVTANVTTRLVRWLDGVDEMAQATAAIPLAPGFLMTPTAKQITDTLIYAQAMPEMVIITTGAGMGKSMTCQFFADTRAHVFMVTMRPTTSTVHGLLQELAVALDVPERNPARLDRAIGEKLRRNGRHTLLVIDEAQNLNDNAVNQLRFFLDVFGCGIALVGNKELYGRFGSTKVDPAYAQLHRRIGKRYQRMAPTDQDIAILVEAWGITDPAIVRLANALGRKPGALSQVSKTLTLAGMYAAGEGRNIAAEDVKSAIQNRGLEDH